MTKPTPEQKIEDLVQQNRAWEVVATRSVAGRVQAERLLAVAAEREQELAATVRSLQARVAEMGELVATSIGRVNEVAETAQRVAVERIDAEEASGWKRRHDHCELQRVAAWEKVAELERFISRTGDERAECIQRGAAVMREQIARHVQTHPHKALGSEIANHIRHALPLPTVEDVERHFTPQPADA